MSYFLWIEDFESSPQVTANNVFGNTLNANLFSDKKHQLKNNLQEQGVFIELSFQDGLNFIRKNLPKIDYVILDIDLPAYSSDDEVNTDVLRLLSDFQDYEKLEDEAENEALIAKNCTQLKAIAGFYLYTELVVELGFPKEHILFCSDHGINTASIQDAFKTAKIALPNIYEKANPEVKKWITQKSDNPYSQLRRGIIEGCQYIAKNLNPDKLCFNDFIGETEKQVTLDGMRDYLGVLANFLPLREPIDKGAIYKLFIRTLSHEWEAAEPRKIRGLASIMKNTRNWITHNSSLFNSLDEKIVAYLFITNMRIMFNFDETIQSFEKILLNLFMDNILSVEDLKVQTRNDLIPFNKTYLDLKNKVLDERQDKRNNVQDGFYFNELANNLQQSNSSFRNDRQLFTKLLFQMFWLTTSNPYISTGNRRNLLEIKFWNFKYTEKPYIFEIARHIYSDSFL